MKIKAPKQPAAAAVPIPRRDDALDTIRREQILRRRRGGAADILTGADGAEAAPAGAKALLGA